VAKLKPRSSTLAAAAAAGAFGGALAGGNGGFLAAVTLDSPPVELGAPRRQALPPRVVTRERTARRRSRSPPDTHLLRANQWSLEGLRLPTDRGADLSHGRRNDGRLPCRLRSRMRLSRASRARCQGWTSRHWGTPCRGNGAAATRVSAITEQAGNPLPQPHEVAHSPVVISPSYLTTRAAPRSLTSSTFPTTSDGAEMITPSVVVTM
jgi:hypothetical protein